MHLHLMSPLKYMRVGVMGYLQGKEHSRVVTQGLEQARVENPDPGDQEGRPRGSVDMVLQMGGTGHQVIWAQASGVGAAERDSASTSLCLAHTVKGSVASLLRPLSSASHASHSKASQLHSCHDCSLLGLPALVPAPFTMAPASLTASSSSRPPAVAPTAQLLTCGLCQDPVTQSTPGEALAQCSRIPGEGVDSHLPSCGPGTFSLSGILPPTALRSRTYRDLGSRPPAPPGRQ